MSNILIKSLTKRYLNVESVSKRARFDVTIDKNNKLSDDKNEYFAI